jgi:hypothetical protein
MSTEIPAPPPPPQEYSRRQLFGRAARGVGVGAVAAAAIYVAEIPLLDGLEGYGIPTGNAYITQAEEQQCGDQAGTPECNRKVIQDGRSFVGTYVEDAAAEEELFRLLPATITEFTLGKHRRGPVLRNILLGYKADGPLGMTRRDVVVGAVTSLAFGAVHNMTDNGFDTHTLPAGQIAGGGALWWLQRRFGFLSNVTAHSGYNMLVAATARFQSRA